jgi:hypothetical protein
MPTGELVVNDGTLMITGIPKHGAKGIRTPDLLGAIQALSQLSYSPARAQV